MIKRISLVLLIALLSAFVGRVAYAASFSFSVTSLSISRTPGNKGVIRTGVTMDPVFYSGKNCDLLFPSARYNLQGPNDGMILRENDVLYSMFYCDINQDGDHNDEWSFIFNRGEMVISGHRYPPIRRVLNNDTAVWDFTRYSRDNDNPGHLPDFYLLYPVSDKSPIVIMSGSQGSPLTLKKFPNPALLLSVSFLSGDREPRFPGTEGYITMTNIASDPGLSGDSVIRYWTMISVPSDINLTGAIYQEIDNIPSSCEISASLMYSPSPGIIHESQQRIIQE